MSAIDEITSHIPTVFRPLMRPARYKVMFGGRGAGKTMNVATIIIALCYTRPVIDGKPFRVLCGREYQSSIAESVHYELMSAINAMGLSPWFKIGPTSIRCKLNGAAILFRGTHHNFDQIKSLGGIDLFWGEEAHSMTQDSLTYLDPTIRRDPPFGPFGQGSELWFTFNQHEETDPVYVQFKCERGAWETADDGGTIVIPCTWRDNPYFPKVLERQRVAMERDDDKGIYEWVWGTSCRRMGSAVIYKGRFAVEEFETPILVDEPRFYHGVDWGFAVDPTCMIRQWVKDNELYIDREAYAGIGVSLGGRDRSVAHGVELEELPALFAGDDTEMVPRWENPVPESRGGTGIHWPGIATSIKWPIKADSARPELISYVRRRGFTIDAAEKWPGSVEDGIAHIKGFNKIHIHQRCKNTAREARLYSYKVDKMTGDVLPQVLSKHDHTWDAVRYALDGYIQRRGGLAVWEKLGEM